MPSTTPRYAVGYRLQIIGNGRDLDRDPRPLSHGHPIGEHVIVREVENDHDSGRWVYFTEATETKPPAPIPLRQYVRESDLAPVFPADLGEKIANTPAEDAEPWKPVVGEIVRVVAAHKDSNGDPTHGLTIGSTGKVLGATSRTFTVEGPYSGAFGDLTPVGEPVTQVLVLDEIAPYHGDTADETPSVKVGDVVRIVSNVDPETGEPYHDFPLGSLAQAVVVSSRGGVFSGVHGGAWYDGLAGEVGSQILNPAHFEIVTDRSTVARIVGDSLIPGSEPIHALPIGSLAEIITGPRPFAAGIEVFVVEGVDSGIWKGDVTAAGQGPGTLREQVLPSTMIERLA